MIHGVRLTTVGPWGIQFCGAMSVCNCNVKLQL